MYYMFMECYPLMNLPKHKGISNVSIMIKIARPYTILITNFNQASKCPHRWEHGCISCSNPHGNQRKDQIAFMVKR